MMKFPIYTAGHGKTLGLAYGEILHTRALRPAAIFGWAAAAGVSGAVCMAGRAFAVSLGHGGGVPHQ